MNLGTNRESRPFDRPSADEAPTFSFACKTKILQTSYNQQ